MVIYVLEKFKNIHNKKEIYEVNKIYEVSDERYKEILKNMKKQKKNLIRKATDEEVKQYLALNVSSNNLDSNKDNNDLVKKEGQDNDD